MKKTKWLSTLMSVVITGTMICTMIPNVAAVTAADLVSGGTNVIQESDVDAVVAGTSDTVVMDLTSYPYTTTTVTSGTLPNGFCEAVAYPSLADPSTWKGFKVNSIKKDNPSACKLSIPIPNNQTINAGDVCIVSFYCNCEWSSTGCGSQKYQTALRKNDGTLISVSPLLELSANSRNVQYIPFKAITSYTSGDFFDMYFGFSDMTEKCIIHDVKLTNISQNYTLRQVRDTLGLNAGGLTKSNILASGINVINNSALVSTLATNIGSTAENISAKFADNSSTYQNQNYCSKCNGMKFVVADGNSDVTGAKLSIPTSCNIKQGDLCIITFNAVKAWAPKSLLLQFAVKQGANSFFSHVVGVNSNYDSSNYVFTNPFVTTMVADKDYTTGAQFDICVGFNNYESGFIGGITVTDIGNDYTKAEVGTAFSLNCDMSNLTIDDVSTDNTNNVTKVRFVANADSQINPVYVVALYNDTQLIGVNLANNISTGTVAKAISVQIPGVCTNPKVKVMAFDSMTTIKPLLKYAEQ